MQFEIRFAKVVPFEQEWRVSDCGNGIGEAVAHVKGSWMASPAKALERVFDNAFRRMRRS